MRNKIFISFAITFLLVLSAVSAADVVLVSDNIADSAAAEALANEIGAEVIEVHVTLDKSKNYIDNNVSFDFNELKNLIELIHKVESINK